MPRMQELDLMYWSCRVQNFCNGNGEGVGGRRALLSYPPPQYPSPWPPDIQNLPTPMCQSAS